VNCGVHRSWHAGDALRSRTTDDGSREASLGWLAVRDEEHHQVVIVGGGPAGVSCALECKDVQLDIVLLDAEPSLGGQLAEIPHVVHNVVFAGFERGEELQESLRRSSTILGDRIRTGSRVKGVDLHARWVDTGTRLIYADALVVATGSTRRQLRAAPDGACGGDVTYRVEGRTGRFAGRPVAVVGGGDSAVLDALELAGAGSPVLLLHRSEHLTARLDLVRDLRKQRLIEDLPGWEIEAVHGTDHLERIDISCRRTGERRSVAVNGVVVKISYGPATEVFAGQLELDARGAVVVDDRLRTSCSGVFAAGDVTAGSYPRIATALGQGALAARSVLRHLEGRS